jgi:hypothetical protein
MGREAYRRRQESSGLVYGHTKRNRKICRFNDRGRQAAGAEWRNSLGGWVFPRLARS